VDETVLVMSERQGVEIDYCPQCRGVWLDRGELDKLIDRADDDDDDDRYERREPRRDEPRYEQPRGGGYPKHKKKKSFLSEIFELGG
jgi:hypothetical protein